MNGVKRMEVAVSLLFATEDGWGKVQVESARALVDVETG